jgi:hypothetical protein
MRDFGCGIGESKIPFVLSLFVFSIRCVLWGWVSNGRKEKRQTAKWSGERRAKEEAGLLAMAYSHVGKPQTTIGAGGLNCRVREGTGCAPAAQITNNPEEIVNIEL